MTLRYVEAKPNEDWDSASSEFCGWVGEQIRDLNNCGFVEGAPIQVNGRRFLGFDIPARHAQLTALFLAWASSSNRRLGVVEGERLVFPDEPGLLADLPLSERSIPTPPWLKDI